VRGVYLTTSHSRSGNIPHSQTVLQLSAFANAPPESERSKTAVPTTLRMEVFPSCDVIAVEGSTSRLLDQENRELRDYVNPIYPAHDPCENTQAIRICNNEQAAIPADAQFG
jgi:hypothetical protein